MPFPVLDEPSPLAKDFATDVAAVGFQSGETLHVRFEMAAGVKQLPALPAAVRSVTGVRPPVHNQVLLLDEGLAAVLASEVFAPRVRF